MVNMTYIFFGGGGGDQRFGNIQNALWSLADEWCGMGMDGVLNKI